MDNKYEPVKPPKPQAIVLYNHRGERIIRKRPYGFSQPVEKKK